MPHLRPLGQLSIDSPPVHPSEIGEMNRRDMRDFFNPCFAEILMISRVSQRWTSTTEIRFRVRTVMTSSIPLHNKRHYSTPRLIWQGAASDFSRRTGAPLPRCLRRAQKPNVSIHFRQKNTESTGRFIDIARGLCYNFLRIRKRI